MPMAVEKCRGDWTKFPPSKRPMTEEQTRHPLHWFTDSHRATLPSQWVRQTLSCGTMKALSSHIDSAFQHYEVITIPRNLITAIIFNGIAPIRLSHEMLCRGMTISLN